MGTSGEDLSGHTADNVQRGQKEPSVWDEVRAYVEDRLNPETFRTWFRPTSLIAVKGESVHVRVPNQRFKDWLTHQYAELLTQALQSLGHNARRVEFETEDESPSAPRAQANDSHQAVARGDRRQAQEIPWPELEPAALCGLAGDIVRAIEPHTEADRIALLTQVLTVTGTLIGRTAYFVAEGSRHFTNLYAVLVGLTSKGRKGSAWARVKGLFESVDSHGFDRHVKSGLTSGEGLIWAVRDPVEKREPIKEKGRVQGYETVIADHGVRDKRLLIVEEEFASVLRVIARGGNTLSAQIRTAWDTGNIRVLTKNSPIQSTDAHIAILGHITCEELRRYLDNIEAGNGFANRFLWLCVRRSKLLPDGGCPDSELMHSLAAQLGAVIEHSRSVTEMNRDDKARSLWREVYPRLSDGKPGLLGAVTSRAEAQTMRLACLYALLDHCSEVAAHHLSAALALWNYAEASARWIFGNSVGEPLADELLAVLRQSHDGLTRTEIRDHFGRHRSTEVGRGLLLLEQLGLAKRLCEDTLGRPIERWFATPSRPADQTAR